MDTQEANERVDVLVRPDRSGYFELFIPKEKALILEMVERCAEEEVMVRRYWSLMLKMKVLEELSHRSMTYDDEHETYKVYRKCA